MAIFESLFRRSAKTASRQSHTPPAEPAVTAFELFRSGAPPVPEEALSATEDQPPPADLTPPFAEPQLEVDDGSVEPVPIGLPEATEAAAPAAVAAVRDIAALLGDFETLGTSPEFSVLRQTLGAVPDGLFGFSTVNPAVLIALLQSRFEGVGAREALQARTANGRYFIIDTSCGLGWETDIAVHEMDPAAAIARESDRLTPLGHALIAHLTENRRLFVYAGLAPPETITALRDAMRAFGDNALLHVVEGDLVHAPGTVTTVEPGLYRGYLSHYASRDGTCAMAVDQWVAICGQAHALWTQAGGRV